jgi:hypothetical protein
VSERYEGVAFCASVGEATDVVGQVNTDLMLQQERLSARVAGVVRVAEAMASFEEASVCAIAAAISELGRPAAALFYDNSCGYRRAVVYEGGRVRRELGEDDELWVPLSANGEPMRQATPLRLDQLRDGEEYECVRSAIDLALGEVGADVDSAVVKQRFCYSRSN